MAMSVCVYAEHKLSPPGVRNCNRMDAHRKQWPGRDDDDGRVRRIVSHGPLLHQQVRVDEADPGIGSRKGKLIHLFAV